MKPLANLLKDLPASATIAVNDKAKALRAAGRDIIVLAGGDPNFDTPTHIQDVAFQAIRSGDTHYPAPTKATMPAVEAIAAKYERDTGLSADKSNIIVTPGGKWGLNLALGALLNPGDEVLYLEPVWVSYPPMITIAGGKAVPVTLPSDDNFRISAELLRQSITEKSKVLMVNTPCNPTGRVLTQSEIDAIVEVSIEADLYVIFDELYEQIIYNGEHIPLASQPGMAERTITINGLSKAYAMTGWRLGWMVGPSEIIGLCAKFHSQMITSAASFGMAAMAAALNGPHDEVVAMTSEYRQRRDFMVDALNAIDGIECRSIEGAFYLFPKFTKTTKNSLEIANYLLDHGVAGVPGSAFGAAGEGHMRFSIATTMSDLEKAAERLAACVPNMP